MGRPTKFNSETRQAVISAMSLGASVRTAARAAGVSHASVERWLEKGRTASEGSAWREFYVDVERARAVLPVRALATIHNELPTRPDLAKWVVERLEEHFRPPERPVGHAIGPNMVENLQINLSFADGRPIPNPLFEPRPPVWSLEDGEDDDDDTA